MERLKGNNQFKNYVLNNIKLEKQMHNRRQTFIEKGDKLKAYFNATPTKNIIGKYLVEAKLDVNLLYTCSSIAIQINASRTAVCKIAQECVDAEWAEYYYYNEKRYIRASVTHLISYFDYCEDLVKIRNELVTEYCMSKKISENL